MHRHGRDLAHRQRVERRARAETRRLHQRDGVRERGLQPGLTLPGLSLRRHRVLVPAGDEVGRDKANSKPHSELR